MSRSSSHTRSSETVCLIEDVMVCKGQGGRAWNYATAEAAHAAEWQGGHVTSWGDMTARTVVAVCGFLWQCSAVPMWQCVWRQRALRIEPHDSTARAYEVGSVHVRVRERRRLELSRVHLHAHEPSTLITARSRALCAWMESMRVRKRAYNRRCAGKTERLTEHVPECMETRHGERLT